MSRPSLDEKPKHCTDAVVLAGSKGTQAFAVGGKQVWKPYLELGGKPLVCRVVGSLLQAERIGNVYVVGDPGALRLALTPLMDRYPGRITLVPEGDNLVENCFRAFFLHILTDKGLLKIECENLDPEHLRAYHQRHREHKKIPALFVASDLPFISADAVDAFLNLVPEDAELAFGIVDHKHLEKMRGVLGEDVGLDMWKLGALHLSGESVRLNNLFYVRPLSANPMVYPLLLKLYQHRWLLKQDGSVDSGNWWALSKSMMAYAYRLPGRMRFLRAMVNFIPAVSAMFFARITSRIGRGKWLAKPYRVLLRRRDMEFVGSLMVGIRGYLTMSPHPGPAIDIDVEESYRALIDNQERAYRKIKLYLENEFR